MPLLWRSLLLAWPGRAFADEPGTPAIVGPAIRQPVALVVVDGGKTLLVANRRSGSLSVVDLASRKVVAEHDVGRGLADLAVLPDGRHLLAVDRAANELLLIEYSDRSTARRRPARGRAGPGPRRRVARRLVGRRGLDLVAPADVRQPGTPRPRGPTLDCRSPAPSTCRSVRARWRFSPTAPGWSSPTPSAAGSRSSTSVAVPIDSVRSLPAHNIRGLAFSPDGRTLVIAHQVLNRLAQTSFDDVHWGQLIRNHLRVLRAESLLKAGSDAALLDGGRLFDLGDVGYAAGDPGAIAFDRRGKLIVALAGMDEVAIAAGLDQGPRRIVVGRRPTAVACSPDGEFVYVADSLDDTISVVATATGQRPATISPGPAARADGGRPGRAAVLQRQALARRLDELP